ncbi:c-type cytochrome [Aliidongia dinghuensis]|uniref:c-type cytochrome n=1 Tax=Aliidongia dinghuensis TaxID=1867774 RepID=UPI001E328390|nr:cytochrome c family protein [Aliidongia dinghuensis]
MLAGLASVMTMVATGARAEDDGAQIFRRTCALCHSIEAGKNRVGPSLAGVVGRPASSIPDFSYSTANKASHVVWTPEVLDRYLTDPRGFMPGTKMTFAGLKDEADRQAVITFLKAH